MEEPTQPNGKIGLALGGGGARGLAHIGLLKVLDREQIPVGWIAGTSMGGLVGAMYAAGYPAVEIEREALQLTKIRGLFKLIDLRLRPSGVLKGLRVYQVMAEKLGPNRNFSELEIPTAMVAVDIKTGRQVVLTRGSVAAAVRATISVPGVFTPVEFGDYRLVDGGLLNNVPVDVARKLGAPMVLAMDVLPNFSPNQPGKPPVVGPLNIRMMPRFAKETWHLMMIMIASMTEMRLKEFPPDLLLDPDLPDDMGLFIGFERASDAIAAGEAAAEAALPEIRALLET